MKKIILSIVVSLITFSSFSKDVVVIERTRGGADGYQYIEEEHFDQTCDGISDFYHDLKCRYPGQSPCEWVFPPGVNGTSVITIQFEVANLMASGTLNGSATYTNCTVVWSGQDIYNYKITITYNG